MAKNVDLGRRFAAIIPENAALIPKNAALIPDEKLTKTLNHDFAALIPENAAVIPENAAIIPGRSGLTFLVDHFLGCPKDHENITFDAETGSWGFPVTFFYRHQL